MANNALRMSGLNSGLDTEAIVNALTAATKNKINKNQRSILKLQAQQEAYRTIINKFNTFKNKYFDILNVNTCLKSKTMFGSFKSTLTSSTGNNYVPGVTVTSSTTANTGTYNVTVNQVATQSTYKSSSETGKEVNFDHLESGKDYTMAVKVGSKTSTVTFTYNGDLDDVQDQINAQLREDFGVSNNDTNLVSLEKSGDGYKFASADKSSVVFTKPAIYASSREADLKGQLKTGNNSFTITINGVSKTVTFSTIEDGYFDDIFEDDGVTLKDESELDKEGKAKLALFKEVARNQREGDVYNSYKDWWDSISDEDKAAFAKEVATEEYNSAKAQYEESYEQILKNVMAKQAYEAKVESGEISDNKDDENYQSFTDFADSFVYSEEDFEAFISDGEGKKIYDEYQSRLKELDDMFDGYNQDVIDKETKAVYDEKFAAAKQAAYDEAVSNGDFEGDIEDFEYTEEQFKETTQYTEYESAKSDIEAKYGNGVYTVDIDKMSASQRMAMYDKYVYSKQGEEYTEEYYINHFDKDEAVYQFNKSNIENNLNSLKFGAGGSMGINASYGRDGKLTIEGVYNVDGIPGAPRFAITSNGGANDFGFETTDVSGTASQISTTSKLSELGLEPDENGNYSFSINGVSFSFSGDTTVSEMMKKVSASEAGVKMTYTTLTNQFILTSNEYGKGVDITFEDGGQGLLAALGFGNSSGDGVGEFTEGQNTNLTINGVDVETSSNSYTVDGTTFTFTQAAEGQTFTNEVSRDYSKAIDTIKSFVEDYNKLIDDIYGYVDDEPNNDYYFLTDDDLDEMDLSDSQVAKWEKMANKGLLYRDSTLTDIMSRLRTVLYNSVDAADGSKVGLYTLGITTSSDYSNHGKLVFDETKDFEALFEKYADEITELFTNTETGIATQFESIIDSAVRTTGAAGERGTLVDKAGVSGTASATSNTIYNKIKSLQDLILTLQARYEQQQDRYWKIYGNMETMLGNLNSQTSYINQLMGNF